MNRLAGQPSAYLASAAHQPVHWYPWGDEAFAAARAADRPVLLDIGAVWCHWCHVMDGESYEDTALAAYLNDHFVCVKVDRDERPDVDTRYQRAVQALTGQGGWPLTAFLTPDGDVFHGGTYFPPDERHGRVGFRTVLERVRAVYAEQRDKVDATARELRGHVTTSLVEAQPGPLDPALLSQAADRMARVFDWRHGGFGTAPKFPHPGAVEFLLARWWDTGAPWLREIAERTLSGMARGGVVDQLGGGFHRYSVDERWCVPHFEKMAYDNAELLRAYLHAHAAWGVPLYRETAEGIIAWTFEVMWDAERGAFAASQDADVGLHDDGDYFTWTPDEAYAVLDKAEWEVAHRRWDIYPEGEMHHRPAKNVLWAARTTAALADELGLEEARVRDLLETARAKLKAARDRRPMPFVDRTCYVSWNAMTAEAFLEAGAILGRKDCTDAALRVLSRIWDEGLVPGHGLPHRLGVPGPHSGPWLLDDQVYAASAFLSAYEHTGDGRWLDRAREIVDLMLAFYWDEPAGGFFDTREQAGGFLAARSKPVQDAPSASPNAVAAHVLLRLAVLGDEPAFRDRAERTLAAFAGSAADLGIHGAAFFRALDLLLQRATTVTIAEEGDGQPLAAEALATYCPRRVVVRRRTSPVPGVPAPVAVVCAGTACAAPVGDAAALRETLATFGRGR